jgi:ubiquinone/menaquinone biosynthesis C-methylase UbiE
METAAQQAIWENLTADEDLNSLLRCVQHPYAFQAELKVILDSYCRDGSRILEAGSSTGITSFILDDRFDKTLVDLNAAAIKLSRGLFEYFQKKATFVVGDMFRLSLPDEYFDVVFNSGVLEHFEYQDRVRALTEYGRVLRPEGILLVAFPNHFSKPYKLTYDYLNSKGRWPYPREIALYDMRKELEEAGLRLMERRILDRKTPLAYLAHLGPLRIVLKLLYALTGYEGYLTTVTAEKCK